MGYEVIVHKDLSMELTARDVRVSPTTITIEEVRISLKYPETHNTT